MFEFEHVSFDADFTWTGVLGLAFTWFLSFGGAYAANGFLAMAVGALSTRERVIKTVWRYRIVLDLGIAFVAMIIPLLVPRTWINS